MSFNAKMKLTTILLLANLAFFNDAYGFIKIRPLGSHVTKPLGSSIVFTCEFHSDVDEDDNGKNILTWSGKEGKIDDDSPGRMYIEEEGAYLTKLYIISIEEEDAGEYICSRGLEKKSVHLQLFKEISFDDAPAWQYIDIDNDGLIRCVVSGLPKPRVLWRSKSGKISPTSESQNHFKDSRYVIETEGLKIFNVTSEDAGLYTCIAEVDVDGRYNDRRINVVVNFPPVVEEGIGQLEAIEGEQLTLSCRAGGLPFPAFRFFKNISENETVEISSRANITELDAENGTLVMLSVNKQDEGHYECRAVNNLGSNSQFGSLKVLVPPSVTLPASVTTTLGSTVTINCIGRGDPFPEMYFSRGEEKRNLDPAAGKITMVRSDDRLTLIIRDADVTDSNIYFCASTNSVGFVEKQMLLAVQFGPTFSEAMENLVYYGWPGKVVNISCIVHGEPQVTVQWFKKNGDEPLVNDEHFHTFKTSTGSILQVNLDASWNVEGIYFTYTCRATNLIGSNDADVELKEVFVPEIPRVKISRVRSDDVLINIIYSDDGDSPLTITSYFLRVMKDGEVIRNITVPNRTGDGESVDVVIDQLLPNQTHVLGVRALNEVGVSDATDVEFTTDASRVPDEVIANVTLLESNSIVLSWLPPYSGGSDIIKYLISHRKVESPGDGSHRPLTKWNDFSFQCCLSSQHPPQLVLSLSGAVDQQLQQNLEIFQKQQERLTYEIVNLDASATYQVKVVAVTSIGKSPSQHGFFVKTIPGDVSFFPAILQPSNSTVIITLMILIILVFLIIVDITCYIINGCGVTMCLCIHACGRSRRPPMKKTKPEKEIEDLETPTEVVVQVPTGASDETLTVVVVDNSPLKCMKGSPFEDKEQLEDDINHHYHQSQEEVEKNLLLGDEKCNHDDDDDDDDDDDGTTEVDDDDDDDKLPFPPPPPLMISSSSSAYDEKPELIIPKNRKSIKSFGDVRWKDVVQELETQLGVKKSESDQFRNDDDEDDEEYTGHPSPKWRHT